MYKTEMRNPKTKNLDKMSSLEIASVMNEENMNAVKSLEPAMDDIAKAIDVSALSIQKGGRLIYIGAGTSGRLGVLDASECPPTFGVDYETVIGLIAGGKEAMFRASENAEDSYECGVRDVKAINLSNKDTLVGISANGNAQYVVGALEYAKSIGATTIGLCCNNECKIIEISDIKIVTETGPEVLTGSTRLKAGTAQKLVLNMISTGAMVKCENVYENLMINLKPSNKKLKNRMVTIVMDILGISYEEAYKKLEQSNWVIRTAVNK